MLRPLLVVACLLALSGSGIVDASPAPSAGPCARLIYDLDVPTCVNCILHPPCIWTDIPRPWEAHQ